jgi:hypothetical protein
MVLDHEEAVRRFCRNWKFGHSNDLRCIIFDCNGARDIVYNIEDAAVEDVPPCTIHSQGVDARGRTGSCSAIRVLKWKIDLPKAFGTIEATEGFFSQICTEWKLPSDFLRKLESKHGPLFKYHLEHGNEQLQSRSSQSLPHLTAVNVAIRWGREDGVFFNCIGRHDFRKAVFNVILISNALPGIDEGGSLPQIMNEWAEELQDDAMHLIGILLRCCLKSSNDFISILVKRRYEMEITLGITPTFDVFCDSMGYRKLNATDEECNAEIYDLVDDTILQSTIFHQLCDIGKQLLSFGQIVQANMPAQKPSRHVLSSNVWTEVHDVVQEIKLRMHFLIGLERTLQNQFSFLRNRIQGRETSITRQIAAATQEDSSAMKTIAGVTLAFLPATSISAVFSTTVFNFQNWHTDGNLRVISRGWWVYFISCIGSTIITVGVSYYWGRQEVKKRKSIANGAEQAKASDSRDEEQGTTLQNLPMLTGRSFLDNKCGNGPLGQ